MNADGKKQFHTQKKEALHKPYEHVLTRRNQVNHLNSKVCQQRVNKDHWQLRQIHRQDLRVVQAQWQSWHQVKRRHRVRYLLTHIDRYAYDCWRHHQSGDRTNRLSQWDCMQDDKTPTCKKIRLQLDLKDLNKNIKREHYYSRIIYRILSLLHNKMYFSVVDNRKKTPNVELDEKSSLMCMFNTPFGRYKFNMLKFRIKVSQNIV